VRRTLAALGVLAVVVVAAVALLRSTGDAAHAPTRPRPGAAQQAINGPPTPAAIARRPLDVALKDRDDPVRLRLHDPPRGALLFDLDTGRVLWRRDPERVLPMASVAKMMTALVVVAHSEPDDRVRVTKQALAYRGSGLGVLPKGRRIRLEAMLNGLLVASGNDAAIALAQRIGGTVAGFVRMMNEQAARMGLRCTHFSRPDGLQDRGNHTCAADLAALARAVLDQPRLARIVDKPQVVLPFPIKGGKLWLRSHNPLIVTGYRGATGIKTGYTDEAGECIVGTATRHGRRVGVVLLHSPDLAGQSRRLLDAGFDTLG
jgi:serine-type D-Ala-D-Ala carboxypeptidase (penicillin-binding protein 5/6)